MGPGLAGPVSGLGDVRVEPVDAGVTTELRRAALRPHFAPGTPMFGDDRTDVVHLAALAGGTAVGACVLLRAPYPHRDEPDAWQLRAMATAAEHRGRGIGALVLAGAADTVARLGGRLLWCKARGIAVPFYERNGFVVDTAEYVEPETGLPHRDMYRRLTAA